MNRVSSTDFQQSVGSYSDEAMQSPVVITSHNRDRLVLMSIQEFQRLKEYEEKMNEETENQIQDILTTHRDTLTELANR